MMEGKDDTRTFKKMTYSSKNLNRPRETSKFVAEQPGAVSFLSFAPEGGPGNPKKPPVAAKTRLGNACHGGGCGDTSRLNESELTMTTSSGVVALLKVSLTLWGTSF
jgi:hypothetical protein